jgi:hypothetical protein
MGLVRLFAVPDPAATCTPWAPILAAPTPIAVAKVRFAYLTAPSSCGDGGGTLTARAQDASQLARIGGVPRSPRSRGANGPAGGMPMRALISCARDDPEHGSGRRTDQRAVDLGRPAAT